MLYLGYTMAEQPRSCYLAFASTTQELNVKNIKYKAGQQVIFYPKWTTFCWKWASQYMCSLCGVIVYYTLLYFYISFIYGRTFSCISNGVPPLCVTFLALHRDGIWFVLVWGAVCRTDESHFLARHYHGGIVCGGVPAAVLWGCRWCGRRVWSEGVGSWPRDPTVLHSPQQSTEQFQIITVIILLL